MQASCCALVFVVFLVSMALFVFPSQKEDR
jgi:hypothetical protein